MGGAENWRLWPVIGILLASCGGGHLSTPEPAQLSAPNPPATAADLTILHLNDHHSHLQAQGEADAAMMNRVCFDAFVVGNHEFDGGDTGLARFLDALDNGDCNTAVLGANVVPGPDSALASGYLQPYTVVRRGGAEVGIVGLIIAIPGQGRSLLCDSAASYHHGGAAANLVALSFLAATPSADIALQNAGGVRGDLAAGDFTMADAFALLPFSNTLVTLNLTGAELVVVLEQGLDRALASPKVTGHKRFMPRARAYTRL